MKKQFILFALSLILFSCKQEPGEIRGIVTYFFNDSQGYKPDVGTEIYVSNLKTDSLILYYDAKSLMTSGTYGYSVGSDDLPYTNDLANTELQKKRSNIIQALSIDSVLEKKYDAVDASFDYKTPIKIFRLTLENQLKVVTELLSIFKNDANYRRFMKSQEQLIKNIRSSQESYKAQVDANGNYSIPQVKPDNYTVLIYTANGGENIPPKVMSITVDSKQIVSVNARFD